MRTKHSKGNKESSGNLIAHKYLSNGGVLCSFGREHGDEHCGIVQISAHIIEVKDEVFHKYVKNPSDNIWRGHTVNMNG